MIGKDSFVESYWSYHLGWRIYYEDFSLSGGALVGALVEVWYIFDAVAASADVDTDHLVRNASHILHVSIHGSSHENVVCQVRLWPQLLLEGMDMKIKRLPLRATCFVLVTCFCLSCHIIC